MIATNLDQLFLYNGCTILERHNHSIDAYGEGRFYKPGEDAAIVFSYRDLVFRSHVDQALLLCSCVRPNDIHSKLLASVPKPIHTIIRSQVLERHAPIRQSGNCRLEREYCRVQPADPVSFLAFWESLFQPLLILMATGS